MGHFQPTNDNQIVQSLPGVLPHGTLEQGNYSAPVFFNNYVYFGAVNDTLKAFQLTSGLLSANLLHSPLRRTRIVEGHLRSQPMAAPMGYYGQSRTITRRVACFTRMTQVISPMSCTTAARPGRGTPWMWRRSSAFRSWQTERFSLLPDAAHCIWAVAVKPPDETGETNKLPEEATGRDLCSQVDPALQRL